MNYIEALQKDRYSSGPVWRKLHITRDGSILKLAETLKKTECGKYQVELIN